MTSRRSRFLWMPILLAAVLWVSACSRKIETTRIQINIIQNKAASTYVNGYRRTISGQVLAYHSSHPDADSALLVRANSEARLISWETDPLPASIEGDSYRLVWLAGLERAGWPGKEVHTFDFFVNDQLWFTFRNLKDDNAGKWRVTGKNGAELSFEATLTDRAGDLFGYMFLKFPRSEAKPGLPLTLRVQGRDENSLDWYMTLQYSFQFTPALRAEPALTAAGKQLLRLSFDNLQEGRVVEISAEGMDPVRQALRIGANILYVSVPEVELVHDIPVVISINGELAQRTALWLKPVNRRELYLLSYSHNDIGYTDIQSNVEKKQWQNLDQALRLIKMTREYPWEARFRWNMEVLWPLEGYLAQADEAKRQEVIQAVREGSLGLNALYANELTGLASAPEMTHFTDCARRFSEQYQLPITTALVSDIPGFTWGIVPALAQSGVKYFASAPNSGDRIGHVLEQWGDKPFYWTSQSGKEKVLMWVAGASYSSFHEGDLSRLGDEKILRLMRKLDAAGYPYELLQLPYTIGGDNGPPDPNLSDFVRKWNERYASPRLVLATHGQMFMEFEKRCGASLPVMSGDFTPYWEDGAASTAAETALNRRAADRLLQDEALFAMRPPVPFPTEELQAAWRNVVLWDEHTWGAHNSISEPDLPAVKEQWRIKRQFALDADRISQTLMDRWHAPAALRSTENTIAVYNTNSWPRTDLVLLTRQQSTAGDAVFDEKGNSLPSQRMTTGELAVLLENVPPFSGRRLIVKPGKANNRGNCRVSAGTLANSYLSLSVDLRRGAVESLTWGERKVEWVDRTRAPGLNQYLYVRGKDARDAREPASVRVRVKENGNLVASLLVEAEAPGCKRYAAEYRVMDGLDRVDILDQFDKARVREKEAIHIAFPFLLPDGQLRYDVADGIVRPESDQLAGSCKNFFSIQSWVDISNNDRGVTWVSPDAPLIEIGAITAEQPWAVKARSSSMFYSYVMNNYWHTNYKADQEGPVTFRFSIFPHASFKSDQAVRLGRECKEPLVVVSEDQAAQIPPSLFRVRPAEVLVSSLKALPGADAWLIRLYNATGAPQNAVLEWNAASAITISTSDSSGRAGARISGEIKIAPWDTLYLRVDKIPARSVKR